MAASIAFFVGLAFYYFFRSPTIAQDFFGITNEPLVLDWMRYLQWYPSFAHTLFFTILTWEMLGRQYLWLSLTTWVGLNLCYEILQHEYFNTFSWEFLALFFHGGTFDIFDIFAIFAGGILSYILLVSHESKDENKPYM